LLETTITTEMKPLTIDLIDALTADKKKRKVKLYDRGMSVSVG
jgi:hypothetical protein